MQNFQSWHVSVGSELNGALLQSTRCQGAPASQAVTQNPGLYTVINNSKESIHHGICDISTLVKKLYSCNSILAFFFFFHTE